MFFDMLSINESGGFFPAFMFLGMFLMMAIGLALTVFWVLMIVDCAKRKRFSDGERIAWILVLVFLGFLGAFIYYVAVKRGK